jgi:hypothetical protein
MPYTLLAGDFVIRYPDLPRGGPEPDGDTVKFAPDTPALVERLRRLELAGANAARDELLARLGFTGIVFFADQPNKVESADQDRVRGHVLSNGIDAMVGFIYPGDAPEPDGTIVFLEPPRADESVNTRLLGAGLAYPAFYTTLPAQLRTRFAEHSRTARLRRLAAGRPGRSRRRAVPARPRRARNLHDVVRATGDTVQLTVWPEDFISAPTPDESDP